MALPHSRVMIHQPMGGAQGQAEDIKVRKVEKGGVVVHTMEVRGIAPWYERFSNATKYLENGDIITKSEEAVN